MKEAANKNNPALTTNANKPRVITVIGKVSNKRIGRMIVLSIPKTTAATIAAYRSSTMMPDINSAIKMSPSALKVILRSSVIATL
jgi:hypothetical protein